MINFNIWTKNREWFNCLGVSVRCLCVPIVSFVWHCSNQLRDIFLLLFLGGKGDFGCLFWIFLKQNDTSWFACLQCGIVSSKNYNQFFSYWQSMLLFFFFFGEQRSRGGQMKPEKWNKSTTKWNIARLRFEQKKNRRNKIKQMNTECKRFKNQM